MTLNTFVIHIRQRMINEGLGNFQITAAEVTADALILTLDEGLSFRISLFGPDAVSDDRYRDD